MEIFEVGKNSRPQELDTIFPGQANISILYPPHDSSVGGRGAMTVGNLTKQHHQLYLYSHENHQTRLILEGE